MIWDFSIHSSLEYFDIFLSLKLLGNEDKVQDANNVEGAATKKDLVSAKKSTNLTLTFDIFV